VVKILTIFLVSLLILSAAEAQIKLTSVATNLDNPVDIEDAGDGLGRLFIVLQPGKIVIFDGTKILTSPFLNVTNDVLYGGEQGLLSLAFHPNYLSNGFFFIYYVNKSGNLVLARYQVSSNKNIANSSSKKMFLTISHPTNTNHNGGKVLFGKDGYLYLTVGDGGAGGDPPNNAQNLGTLLGKILRIDVNQGSPYAIPPGNPFVNTTGAKKEIWAYGLRNPWRVSFDQGGTGNMFTADVGQNSWEEIDVSPVPSIGGSNYGWRKMEGKHCFNPSTNCNNGKLRLPALEYGHSSGCSITGGFVYRGTAFPTLVATYLYADYCNGQIWGAIKGTSGWTSSLLLDTPYKISTFGQNKSGELFIAHHIASGAIYKIVKK
jgi:glucose/arabinose dehydrogenase